MNDTRPKQGTAEKASFTVNTYLDLISDVPFLLGEWREEAECRNYDPELWFPSRGGPANEGVKKAKRICKECPVRVECLTYAVDTNQKWGIWGGKNEKELRSIRRKLQAALRSRGIRRYR